MLSQNIVIIPPQINLPNQIHLHQCQLRKINMEERTYQILRIKRQQNS
jgi:hypothetical protein